MSLLEKELRQREINRIVIHCSATPPSVNYSAYKCHLGHIQRGFSRIGYHFYIERTGKIVRGRDIDEVGAHAKGYNSNSIGVCLEGGVNEKGVPEGDYTVEQWASLKTVTTMLASIYPNANISGHRDLPNVNKACPSFDVAGWLAGGMHPYV